jgi:hypothetical protein
MGRIIDRLSDESDNRRFGRAALQIRVRYVKARTPFGAFTISGRQIPSGRAKQPSPGHA